MKNLPLFIAYLLFYPIGYAQTPWTPPAQITFGTDDDIHPALVNDQEWSSHQEEWLAFSRGGQNICVMKSDSGAVNWIDSIFMLTTDSANNDYPSLAREGYPFQSRGNMMLVWQSRRDTNLNVYFSLWSSQTWSHAAPVDVDQADDLRPHVTALDTGFAVVWERDGAIWFSRYRTNSWSAPERVTPPGDSGNSSPQIARLSWPCVIWEKRKPADSSHAIMYSLRQSTGWTFPDALTWEGDNRTPRFYKARPSAVVWESNRSGVWNIMAAGYWFTAGQIRWDTPVQFSSQPSRHAAINGFFIVTQRPPQTAYVDFSVGTWEAGFPEGDSIAVALYWTFAGFLNVAPFTLHRNPDVSCGVWVSEGMRVWSVWENNSSGHWKLYGSNVVLIFFDVDEEPTHPSGFSLSQNYPNPFNPTTSVTYRIPATSHVSLKVYDLLGKEVATIMNERKSPGIYAAQWDAGRCASGLYFLRMHAGSYTATRKILLIR